MVECLCVHGRKYEIIKMFKEAYGVSENDPFSPTDSDTKIMDDFITGNSTDVHRTMLKLKQRLFVMPYTAEKNLIRGLKRLRSFYEDCSYEDRIALQAKKRRKK